MRSAGVHHVDLVVSSIERSLPFYRELLGPLGWHGISEVEGERGETIWYLLGSTTPDRPARAAQSERRPRTTATRVGLHHLAFEATSRAVVDERADWLRPTGARARERAAGVHVLARLLRGVFLRPGRNEARDRPRSGPCGLRKEFTCPRPLRSRLRLLRRRPATAASAARPTTGAILPVPGNAEIAVWLLVEIVLAIVAAVSDGFDAHGWAIATTWLTAAYILSRGIAKASRVLEQ